MEVLGPAWEALGEVRIAPLALGLAIHAAADGVRNGAWLAILRHAHRDTQRLRLRDVEAAAFAGGAVNAIVPARGGDVVKLALVRRRLDSPHPATLASTLAADGLCEAVAGAGLLTWALACGYLPLPPIGRTAALLTAGATVLAAALAWRFVPWRGQIRAGLSALGCPRLLLGRVLAWQLASRSIRLGGVALCLAACGLPATPSSAVLAMALEGATRVRLAPATGALRAAALAAAFAAAGTPVAPAAVVAYVVAIQAGRTVVALAIGVAAGAATLRLRDPRRVVTALRRLTASRGAPVPAPALEQTP
jgi:hypothetical protein